MARNRISGLGITMLGSAMLLAGACDSGGSTTAPTGTGTGTGTGTTTGTGGGSSVVTGVGGRVTTGVGGARTGVGGAATGVGGGATGTVTATAAANCKTATAATGSFTIQTQNYFKVGNFGGYGFVYISPTTDPTKSVTCSNAQFGSSTTALCGAGIVPADPDYNAVGGIGFNLNQPTAGGDPAPAITSPATVSSVGVTFTLTTATDLHIQIVQLKGTTQTNYCYAAKGANSPLTLNASDFNTTCWTTGGTPWDGTGAESFQFVIPSQATADTPFDACIQNVVLN